MTLTLTNADLQPNPEFLPDVLRNVTLAELFRSAPPPRDESGELVSLPIRAAFAAALEAVPHRIDQHRESLRHRLARAREIGLNEIVNQLGT